MRHRDCSVLASIRELALLQAPTREVSLDHLAIGTCASEHLAGLIERAEPRVGVLAKKALETLDLDDTADRVAIKARYKELVKRFHPDANGGDRSREGRLQEILKAYQTLKSSGLV